MTHVSLRMTYTVHIPAYGFGCLGSFPDTLTPFKHVFYFIFCIHEICMHGRWLLHIFVHIYSSDPVLLCHKAKFIQGLDNQFVDEICIMTGH